jgi:predicted ATP-dependent endonuclease of OLD family
MKIENIKIENFRCFKSYEITFGKNTTVLIGKNGTGKTTFIKMLAGILKPDDENVEMPKLSISYKP